VVLSFLVWLWRLLLLELLLFTELVVLFTDVSLPLPLLTLKLLRLNLFPLELFPLFPLFPLQRLRLLAQLHLALSFLRGLDLEDAPLPLEFLAD
jgi:hypothetical protein